MLINEAGKTAKLTKKAIEYYIGQALLSPALLDNGYRDFNDDDIERLKKISVLRRLGLGTDEIKTVLDNENADTLKKISVKKELNVQRERAKNVILNKLGCGKSYAEISTELLAIEQSATITEKILDAFPGYYGRFIALHWARFLNEPLETDEQKLAYAEIVTFLDNSPSLNFPENLQKYLDEAAINISTVDMNVMNEKTKYFIENPETFLAENKDILEYYITYMQSEEYENSPQFQMKTLLTQFNRTSGYYDVLIPAMKKLSPSYAEYCKQSAIANEKLYAQYPEAKMLDNGSK